MKAKPACRSRTAPARACGFQDGKCLQQQNAMKWYDFFNYVKLSCRRWKLFQSPPPCFRPGPGLLGPWLLLITSLLAPHLLAVPLKVNFVSPFCLFPVHFFLVANLLVLGVVSVPLNHLYVTFPLTFHLMPNLVFPAEASRIHKWMGNFKGNTALPVSTFS